MREFVHKKILVTGAGGFLGAHVVRALLGRGVPEKNIYAPSSGDSDLRIWKNCVRAVDGQNIVIHIAGITGNAEFHKAHPGSIFFDNIMMGVGLMEAARQANVEKFVTIGSVAEYPADAENPFREENIWAGFPEKNHAPYAVAKKMLLVQGQAYRAEYGFRAVHLLMTNMYGPGEHEEGGPIPSFIRRISAAKESDVIEIWGTGAPTRDFLNVEDAAEAIVLAAEKYEKIEPINIGSGREVSIKELAETIAKLLNFSGSFKFDATKPDGQTRRVLDVSCAEREFGFSAKTSLETGLQKTIEWYIKKLKMKNEK